MMKRFLTSVLLAGVLGASCLAPIARADGDHLITMQQADIRTFIDDVAIVTGHTILVDPRIQGQVTISSEQSLSKREVWDVFKEVMRLHGYTVVPIGTGEYRVTLLQGAAGDAPLVQNTGLPGQMGTIIIKLNTANADDVGKVIRPIMNASGVISANNNGNVIVMTDFPENLRKAREIVAAMDVDTRSVETFRLTNIRADDAASALTAIAGARPGYSVVAIPANNTLIVEGDAAQIARLRPVISQMDVPNAVPRGSLSLVRLRYADGGDLVESLTPVMESFVTEGTPPPGLSYDPTNNAIIINAEPEAQSAIEQIIRQMDTRRPQVLVEAIIVEVSDTAARDLGLQFALGSESGGDVPFFATNFGSVPPNMLAVAGALAGNGNTTTGSSLQSTAVNSLLGLEGGVLGGAITGSDSIFAVVLNAVQRDTESNVLSTPFVTTLDNVPAIFLVGQDIPIVAGESLGANNINPFRTFQREEIGTKLEVLPQISEGDVIRLEIKQEVSAISPASSASTDGFIINKREIETTVFADNGEIIVLGGLIEDDEQITLDKVPFLGDIPVVGRAFQSEGKERNRTNLMVFLRPTIIRTAADARPITQDRLARSRQLDLEQSGREVPKLDQYIQPVTTE